jgi:hypothetical protein
MPSNEYREHLRQALTRSDVPFSLHDGLIEYFADRRPTGRFLQACLENNFAEACVRADVYNRARLADLAMFLCNYVPQTAWGSPDAVHAWLLSTDPIPEIFE